MIRRVIRIFDRCGFCPFCSDRHIKDVAGYDIVVGYYVKYLCRKSKYREIDKKDLDTFPDWCPLEEETIVDFFTKDRSAKREKESTKRCD